MIKPTLVVLFVNVKRFSCTPRYTANDNVDNPKQSHARSSLSSIISAFYNIGARHSGAGLDPLTATVALFSLLREYFPDLRWMR